MPRKNIELICKYCNKKFLGNKTRKICSVACDFSHRNGKNNSNYNKKWTDENKKHMSLLCLDGRRKGRNNPNYGNKWSKEKKLQHAKNIKNWHKENSWFVAKYIDKMRVARLGMKNGEKQKDIVRKRNAEWNFQNPSGPELKMKNILISLNIDFVQQYFPKIKNPYPADFFIPSINLIIEVDGKYWHDYPKGTEKDKIRNVQLEENGYKIVRFWEGEFDENIVRQKLEQF